MTQEGPDQGEDGEPEEEARANGLEMIGQEMAATSTPWSMAEPKELFQRKTRRWLRSLYARRAQVGERSLRTWAGRVRGIELAAGW